METFYIIAADTVIIIHLSFIIFAVLGGFLVLRWKRVAWLHVPSFLWAAAIEFLGATCPLTPLENWLRASGGSAGYNTGFIEHYIVTLIYPADLTRQIQIILGILVLAVNLCIYGWLLLHLGNENNITKKQHRAG